MVCPDQFINIKLYIFVSSVIEETKIYDNKIFIFFLL